jgi:uncharacterized protein (TIRG00374 family)
VFAQQLSRPWLVRALQLAVAVGLLIVVWRFANGDEALSLLSRAQPGWLVGAAALLSAQVFLSARRWQLTANQLHIRVTFTTALREYYLSQLVNQILPGGVLGDASRAVRSRRQRGLFASTQSVLFERLMGQLALFVVLVVAITMNLMVPGGVDWPGETSRNLLVALVLFATALALALVVVRALPRRRQRVLRQLVEAGRQALLAPEVLGQQVMLSMSTAVANVAGFVLCAWAIGADVPLLPAFAVIPIILFTMVIPVTVSGWGVREAAAAALFPLAGFVSAEGLATSVAFGLVLVVVSLPGLLFMRQSRRTPAPSAGATG